MPVNTSSHKILIAALSGTCPNYEQALITAGFRVLYPKTPLSSAPYIPAQLVSIDFDLLLLPGGGDISPLLYASKSADESASSIAPLSGCNPPDYVTDLLQFQLLQLAFLRNRPVLGICKGMQLLNVYFGGDLYPHLPTAGSHCYTDKDQMHPLYFSTYFPERCSIWGSDIHTSSLLCEILNACPLVNSAHHQGIKKLGKDLLTLQHSEDFLPETIAHRHLPILGLQWHPERLTGFKENNFGKLVHLLLQSTQL